MAVVGKGRVRWDIGSAEHGRFVNGDYYVVGRCQVTRIDRHAGQDKNGNVINPIPGKREQGLDIDMYSNFAQDYWDPNLKVEGVMELNPGDSLISTVSHPTPSRPQLDEAQVLTCLEDHPPAGAFRPPYCRLTGKNVEFNKSDLNTKVIDLNLDLTTDFTLAEIAEIQNNIRNLWLDSAKGWLGRYMHPSLNMPDYGSAMCRALGMGWIAAASSDIPVPTRERILTFLVQIGIDTYGLALGGQTWDADGGHSCGRKGAILLAGYALGNKAMMSFAKNLQSSEEQQTFYGTNGPDWAIVPGRKDLRFYGSSYRRCCTALNWGPQLILSRLLGIEDHWDSALLDYYDKYAILAVPSWRFGHPVFESLWEDYRMNESLYQDEPRSNKLFLFGKPIKKPGDQFKLDLYDTDSTADIFSAYLVAGTKGYSKHGEIESSLDLTKPYHVENLNLVEAFPDLPGAAAHIKHSLGTALGRDELTFQVLVINKDGSFKVSNSVTFDVTKGRIQLPIGG